MVGPWEADEQEPEKMLRTARCTDQYGGYAGDDSLCYLVGKKPATASVASKVTCNCVMSRKLCARSRAPVVSWTDCLFIWQAAGLCDLLGAGVCNGHGICTDGACLCDHGWYGQTCSTQSKCASNLTDAFGDCCEHGVLNKEGECCKAGSAVDRYGACCKSGELDACGVCDGESNLVDARGTCCSDTLDAQGICCKAEMLDECGVCGGDSSSCGMTAELSMSVNPPFGDWEDLLELIVTYLASSLEPFGVTAERLSIVSIDAISADNVRIMSAVAPKRISELSLPDLPKSADEELHLAVTFAMHSPAENSAAGVVPVRILTLGELHETFVSKNASLFRTSQQPIRTFRVGNAVRQSTCDNGWCEWGEQKRPGQKAVGGYCPIDCGVSLQTCPVGPVPGSIEVDECSGRGTCTALTGACDCYTGYTGRNCSLCSIGYVRLPGGCMPLAVIKIQKQEDVVPVMPAAAVPDRPDALSSKLAEDVTLWIVIGTCTGLAAAAGVAAAMYAVVSRQIGRTRPKAAARGGRKNRQNADGSPANCKIPVSPDPGRCELGAPDLGGVSRQGSAGIESKHPLAPSSSFPEQPCTVTIEEAASSRQAVPVTIGSAASHAKAKTPLFPFLHQQCTKIWWDASQPHYQQSPNTKAGPPETVELGGSSGSGSGWNLELAQPAAEYHPAQKPHPGSTRAGTLDMLDQSPARRCISDPAPTQGCITLAGPSSPPCSMAFFPGMRAQHAGEAVVPPASPLNPGQGAKPSDPGTNASVGDGGKEPMVGPRRDENSQALPACLTPPNFSSRASQIYRVRSARTSTAVSRAPVDPTAAIAVSPRKTPFPGHQKPSICEIQPYSIAERCDLPLPPRDQDA